MKITVQSTHLDDVVVLRPHLHRDERGWFVESYRADHLQELGLPGEFTQDNHSRSTRGVIRGLHFQSDPPMGKLMRATVGEAFVVAVDIRKGSPTLGQCYGRRISSEDMLQVWAPEGFARGFCAVSDVVEVQYKCTATYNAVGESGIRWDDPAIGIEWPVDQPILSLKDAEAQTLAEWLERPESDRFAY